MKSLKSILTISLIVCTFACQNDKKQPGATLVQTQKGETMTAEEKEGRRLLEKCIAAHGGLAQWRAFEGLEYNLDDNGKQVYQLTHLKDRRAYLKSKDYQVGFDGKVAWAVPDAKKVSGSSAGFYYNLDFYFVGIPFLLMDPGVLVSHAGKVTIKGEEFESLKVTFGSDVGLTPEDVYYLYLDPASHMLQILTYSISYFNKESAAINSAKVYSDYIDVQGLKMPTKMENFEWKDGSMGKSKNHLRSFSDFKFLKEIHSEELFEVPDGAIVESIAN